MPTTTFPHETYLKKLQLHAPPEPTEHGLHQLHAAQCFAIPFENLEPFLARPVPLGLPDLAEKFLIRGRGGYCFELNSFFLAALVEFGFTARAVLGRVFMGRPEGGPRTHQASLVEIGGRIWLADVGFGGPGLVDPIPFEDGYEGVQQGRKIRLRQHSDWGMLYEDEFEGNWRIIYAIPAEKVLPIDLISGSHYCATHPDSIFRNNLFCVRHSAMGKITVRNRSLNLISNGSKEEKTLNGADDVRRVFQDLMHIPVSQSDVAAIEKKLAALPA